MEDQGINLSILFSTEFEFTLRGGRDTENGCENAGKMFYNLELDFAKMGLVDGATFFARGIQTWNNGIRDDVGALYHPYYSTGSSGDNSLALDKYWYRQRLFDDRLEFRLGKLLAAADLFDGNEYAANYLTQFMNQALYCNPVIPNAKGIGAYVQAWPVEWLYVKLAAIDPDTINVYNRHGTAGWDTVFDGNMRFRAYGELGVLPQHLCIPAQYPGHYRFGVWYDPVTKFAFKDTLGGLLRNEPRGNDSGVYLNFDQLVYKENDDPKDKQGLGIFGRYGWAEREINRLSHHWSIGASYLGLLPERKKDVLGFGIAQTQFSTVYRQVMDGDADRETVYELYYAIQVTPWCVISPDLQMITAPGGDNDARDALVGGLRFKMSF